MISALALQISKELLLKEDGGGKKMLASQDWSWHQIEKFYSNKR